ncbi:hypothetical protein WN55_01748 [Dufourea novaeangliae]|uniref:Uncharacterized protein n=1 Tax=Dufourea novaeangliae TaxID=178035 RepID=A0A154PDN5_DUFNO|nr:hypothetical protein WN55_01748 [Dufourea novaeangliae]
MTWRERIMQGELRRIGMEKRGRGKRVWLAYGRVQIEGRWWYWDEKERKLKNEGRKPDEIRGEKKRGEEEYMGEVLKQGK